LKTIIGQKTSAKRSNELAILIKQPFEEGTTLDEKVKGLLAQGFHLVMKIIVFVDVSR
jgi:hypothetical protein